MATQLAGSVSNTQEQFPYMQGILLLSPGHMGNDTDYWNASAIMVTCPIWSVDKSLNYDYNDHLILCTWKAVCILACSLWLFNHILALILNLQLATKNTGVMPGKEEHYRHQCTGNYWAML